jgi:Protein of unknown function (DUF2511)
MRSVTRVTLASVVGLSVGFTSGLILLPDPPREGIEINKSEYAKGWPLAMAQGRLRCEGAGAVILTVRGTDYAVNGMASNRYRPIQAVMTDPKIDIGPIISRGLTLCKW